MGTIADKLLYLDGTKTALRDAINQAGGYLTTADPFRDYVDDWLRSQSATLSLEFWCERFLTRRRGGMAENALGFANIITFTRDSSGGVFNEYGQYVSLATNVWRPDHDPASVTTSTSTVAFDSLTATFTLPSGHAFQVGDKFRATAVAGSLWGVVVARTDTTATVHARNSTTTGSASSWTCIKPRGILIEEARTNLLTYSEQFDNAVWVKTAASVTANATVSPDGTAGADKLIEDTSASTSHRFFRAFTATTNAAHTYSIFLKKDTRTWARISLFDGSNTWSAFFNLATGAIGTASGTGTTAKIEPVGNEWYRCSVSATGAFTQVATNIATGDNGHIYTGDGTSGLYIWGAQLEAGSFPTSYIPTVASQVTRSADVASVNTLSPWYNATEGTLFVEFQTYRTSGLPTIFSLTGDFFVWGNTGNNSLALNGRGNTGWASVISAPLQSLKKYAIAIDDAGVSVSVNGGTVKSELRARIAPATSLALSGALYGHIRNISYYPRAYSGIVLQEMTR